MMAEFVAQLSPINARADQSRGFMWRLQTESVDALREYAYKSAHQSVLRDRKRWFEKFDGPYYAL